MLENTTLLKITGSNNLSLNLKKPKTILPDTKQNNKNHQNTKIFQEVLDEITMLENETSHKQETMCASEIDNNISTLPSMQINQLLSMKKIK